jgi:lysozyme
MPKSKLIPSKRAAALIAAVVASSVGGFVTLSPGLSPVHDDVALAMKTAGPWEGRHLVAYLDTLPTRPRWTLCDGDTNDVKPYQVATPEECDRRFSQKMEKQYRPPLVACVTDWDKQPLPWRGMTLSLAWNIGPGMTCKSRAVRIVNEAMQLHVVPDYRASCEAATAFNMSGGRVYIGLQLRREMGDNTRVGEGAVCIMSTVQ